MSPKRIELDGAMMISLTAVAGVAVTLSLGALAAFGWSAAMGVATGGLMATVNLYLLALISRGVLSDDRHRRLWGVAGGLKFFALLALAFVLLQAGLVSGITLVAGFASLPVGVTLGILAAGTQKKGPRRSA